MAHSWLMRKVQPKMSHIDSRSDDKTPPILLQALALEDTIGPKDFLPDLLHNLFGRSSHRYRANRCVWTACAMLVGLLQWKDCLPISRLC